MMAGLAFSRRSDLAPALVAGAFLWVMLGLPVDAWFRTGRLSTAFTWALFPWFVGWLTGYALEHLTDPSSLWYVAGAEVLPGPLREIASFPGFVVGLGLCALIERVENRTGKTPTVLPLQVFGALFLFWLATSMADKSLPDSWKQGQFLFAAGAVCLGWLGIRVARTVLNANATRQAIEQRQASR